MRTSVWIAVLMAAVLVLAGCSAKTPGGSLEPSVGTSVLGTSGESSQAAPPAETTTTVVEPDPVALEGMPASLGIQAAPSALQTTVTEAQAMAVAEERKPAGTKSVTVRHVLFAESGDDQPIDAWMITFHGAELPGAGGARSAKTGNVTLFIDSASGAVVTEVAYEPVAQ